MNGFKGRSSGRMHMPGEYRGSPGPYSPGIGQMGPAMGAPAMAPPAIGAGGMPGGVAPTPLPPAPGGVPGGMPMGPGGPTYPGGSIAQGGANLGGMRHQLAQAIANWQARRGGGAPAAMMPGGPAMPMGMR